MSYVHKLINDDEKLIGIARLHWVYILQGLGWFFGLAGSGFVLSLLMNRGMAAMMRLSDNPYIPAPLLGLSTGVMLFMLAAGAMIFAFYVIKVISTSIALTDRRVIHKHGLIFVHAHHIDLEEIRGENLDLGYLGRILGYGYIMLDCRFIGDVKLPAIENPEGFLRALHDRRAHAQDALTLVTGKSDARNPINVVQAGDGEPQQPQQPEVQPPTPEPEVAPTPPDQIPAPPNQPMPNQPPPMDQEKKAAPENTIDKMKPEISRRIEKAKQDLMADIESKQNNKDEIQPPPSLEEIRARGGEEPKIDLHKTQKQTQDDQQKPAQQAQEQPKQNNPSPIHPASQQEPVLSKEEIAKVVEQVTPQIAQEVVKEMAREGLIKPLAPPENDNNVDNSLNHVFDDAAVVKDGSLHHDDNNKLEHAIH